MALLAASRGGKRRRWMSSTFSVATKLSEMALSRAEPARPIEGPMPAFCKRLPKERAVYCALRSEWWTSPVAGFLHTAISRVSTTSSVRILGAQSFPLTDIDLGLLEPIAQHLGGSAEFFCYLVGYWMLLIRSAHEPDGLAAELRWVRRSGSWHLSSFAWTSVAKSPSVYRTEASPLALLPDSASGTQAFLEPCPLLGASSPRDRPPKRAQCRSQVGSRRP